MRSGSTGKYDDDYSLFLLSYFTSNGCINGLYQHSAESESSVEPVGMPYLPVNSSFITPFGDLTAVPQQVPVPDNLSSGVVEGPYYDFPYYDIPISGTKPLDLKSMLRYLKEDRQAYLFLSDKGDTLPSSSSSSSSVIHTN